MMPDSNVTYLEECLHIRSFWKFNAFQMILFAPSHPKPLVDIFLFNALETEIPSAWYLT